MYIRLCTYTLVGGEGQMVDTLEKSLHDSHGFSRTRGGYPNAKDTPGLVRRCVTLALVTRTLMDGAPRTQSSFQHMICMCPCSRPSYTSTSRPSSLNVGF